MFPDAVSAGQPPWGTPMVDPRDQVEPHAGGPISSCVGGRT